MHAAGIRAAWSLALAALLLAVPGGPARAEGPLAPLGRMSLDRDETRLLAVFQAIHAQRYEEALERAERLVRANPGFRLAQLVYADLLAARGGVRLGLRRGRKAARVLADLREEARLRLAHYQNPPPPGRLPEVLVRVAPSARRAVVVDVERHRLYLLERGAGGELRLAADYYVTTGKRGPFKRREGDQRTPVGVYFVTRRLDPSGLSDLYGAGAFPINYPNEWDLRQGRTGYGIWIHGVPAATYNRAPRASDGCLALPNPNVRAIWDALEIGTTPVVITDRARWVGRERLAARRAELLGAIEQWRRDWESRDPGRYARHYAEDFRSERMDRARWLERKRRVNAAKRFVRVRLDDIGIYGYPGEPDMVVVSFRQDYRSSNYNRRSSKRQYWRRGADGRWRILYEGLARFRPIHLRGIPFSARSQTAQR